MSALLAMVPQVQDALARSPARSWLVMARSVDYIGTVPFVGGTAFLATLWPAGTQDIRARGVLAAGLVMGLFGTLLAIVLYGAWVGEVPMAEAFRWEVARSVLDTTFGQVWAAKALLWVLATVVMADLFTRGEQATRSVAWRVIAVVVCAALLRTLGMAGHVAEGGVLVMGIADFVHVAGISLWGGGLAVLLFGLLPRQRPEELATVMPRYSRLVFGSVLAVVTGGIVLSWGLVGSWPELVGSGYGQLLMIKIGIFGAVLVTAIAGKKWFDRRLDVTVARHGGVAVARPFVYSVAMQTVLVAVVLLATSFLVTAVPGR
ncbi:MAG: copper resistance D family protein [Pseudonocardiaceae bacterium]